MGCGNLDEPVKRNADDVQTIEEYLSVQEQEASEPHQIYEPGVARNSQRVDERYPNITGLPYADARLEMTDAGWFPLDLGRTDKFARQCDGGCVSTLELNACDESKVQNCTWIFQHISGKDILVVSTTGTTHENNLKVVRVDYLEDMHPTFIDGTGLK